MRTFADYHNYLLADPRFYEEFGRGDLPFDLELEVRAFALPRHEVLTSGPWVMCRPAVADPLPDHGWKIHVSATPDTAGLALQQVSGEFARTPFHFKCLRDRQMVVAATSRLWPAGQVGKVITIYPRSTDACRDLLDRLHPALADVAGPYILTDRRYRDSRCLYYRYGGFGDTGRIEPDGSSTPMVYGPGDEPWTDERLPVYRRPPWVEDLFPQAGDPPRRAPHVLHGYRLHSALRYTGAGGIYLAQRVEDGASVVLKEARPHTAFGLDGRDGQQRLRAELETLMLLRDTGIAPRPVELFTEWEHLFLVQEHLSAPPLIRFLAGRSPIGMGDLRAATLRAYWNDCDKVLDGVRAAIRVCHDRGISYSDLSLTNVLVCPDTLRVWLVDFESSQPLDRWRPDQPATPGFMAAPGSVACRDGRAYDEFGIASLELAMYMPRNGLRVINETALARSTVHAAGLLRRPVGDLLHRLELPADVGEHGLAADVASAAAVRFIENVMSADRPDRAFPADPAVFTTNPWSVAYGAAGVLRALHRLTGRVPPALMQWMDRAADRLDRMPPGLYFGQAGVAWTLIEAGMPQWGRELLDRALGADLAGLPADIATGAAGLGLAGLAGWVHTGDTGCLETATRIGDHLIGAARDSGTGLYWPRPAGGRHPNGYAYGSSGVSAFLLYLHRATRADRFLRAGRRALNYELVQLQRPIDGTILLPSRVGGRRFEPYWETGLAGFGATLARYCVVTGDVALQDTVDELVRRTLLVTATNAGLFVGAAGVVDFALDCYDLLGESAYHDLAATMADGILALACPEPEGLAFPGHGLLRYSTDFATGNAGIALVLSRLHTGGPSFNYTLDELLPVRRPLVLGGLDAR